MYAVLQRVKQSQVQVNQQCIASIEQGLMVLIGIEKTDQEQQMDKMLHKLLHYRLFADDNDKMNLNIQQINGGLLLVPQFTLAADTKKGLRPSFSSCEEPDLAKQKFDQLLVKAKQLYPIVKSGEFGADMQVSLINDGPVTFNFHIN